MFSLYILFSPLTHPTLSRICQDKLEMLLHLFNNNPHLKAYEDDLDPSWGRLGPTTRCYHDAPLDNLNLADPSCVPVTSGGCHCTHAWGLHRG